MEKLTAEAARILRKRIAAAIYEARYYPAKCENHKAAADRVLAAFRVSEDYSIADASKGEVVFIP